MTKVLREVSGFVALPVTFKVATFPHEAKHYIYVKPHEPQLADEDAPRSLFLVNIPVSTSEVHLKHLFATQLGAGLVERVEFSDNGAKQSSALIAGGKSGRKRKRMTVEELEAGLDAYPFPNPSPGLIHPSGSTAIVVFVDRPSMELSLKAAKRAVKQGKELVWGDGLKDKAPEFGLKRYEAHKSLQYPPRAALLRTVDNFMTAYGAMEEARSKENAKKRQMPDEDGFVTVTRGALKKDEADELKERQKAKEQGLEDFYRFQMREKRKEKQGELLRKFEDDKRKVAEMRMRRGKLKPET